MTVTTPVRLQSTPVDCGATCLGIVLEYHGRVHSSLDLRRQCAVGRDGATVAQIQRGAEALGHRCKIAKKGIESLRKATMPMILHWDLRHFVVLEGISRDRIWINDPAAGRRNLSREEFERHFTGVCLEVIVESGEKEGGGAGPSWSTLHALAPVGNRHLGKAIAIGFAASVLVFTLELLFGGIARAFFDYVVSYQLSWWGYVLALVGIPALAIRFFMRHIQSLRLESQSLDTSLNIKRAFLDRLYARPTVFFDAHFAGELFGRLRDLDQCLRVSLRALHSVVPQTVIILSTTAVLLVVAPIIAAVHIVPRIAMIAWAYVAHKKTHEFELRVRDENDRNRAIQAQRASGFLRFFAAGLQDHLLATCLPRIARWQAARTDYERRFVTFRAAQRTLDIFALPLSAFAGSYLMIEGQLTYGGFMLASALAVILSTHLSELSDTFQRYSALKPVVRRVAEVVEEVERDAGLADIRLPPQENAPIDVQLSPHIAVDRLGFGYNGLDADLFSEVSFAVRRGEVINVFGQSGAGKSTLLDLLAGLRRPIHGSVYFNGELLDGPAPAGFVVADDEFIGGSLASFVASGKEANTEHLINVLKIVELWDRLGFFAGADGRERLELQGLSRGEVQRLMLAQALYRSHECLIFDEAFTHLSFEQSDRILQRLRHLGTTVVMATHRPEIQSLCDRTVVFTQQPGRPATIEEAEPTGPRPDPAIRDGYFQ